MVATRSTRKTTLPARHVHRYGYGFRGPRCRVSPDPVQTLQQSEAHGLRDESGQVVGASTSGNPHHFAASVEKCTTLFASLISTLGSA